MLHSEKTTCGGLVGAKSRSLPRGSLSSETAQIPDAVCVSPKPKSFLPLEIFCQVARNLKAPDLVRMEAAIFGPGNAPQLWEHISQPLQKQFPHYPNLRQVSLRELVKQGLRLPDQVCLSVGDRRIFRKIIEPLGRETPLHRQLLDSNVTLVSKQIQKTILAVKGAARALPRSINGSDDAQSAVSQEFSVLREISRAQPLALERTEGQLRSSGVLAEVLETLSHLSSQVLSAQQDETYEWQSSEAMHQLESINRVFAYVETMYDEKEDDETEE